MEALMTEMNTQMEALPMLVQYWMNWMMLIFVASIAFVWKKPGARFTLLAFILTMPIGMLIFYFSRNVDLLGIAHLILWAPLFYYLYKFEMKREGFTFKSAYGVWTALLMATIAISLVFDIRDIILVIMGHK